MKIAYIILAHKAPEQLVRLIHQLKDDETAFFIHIDKKANEDVFCKLTDRLNPIPNIFFVERYKCYWGSFNIVRATLQAIRQLVESNQDFDYAILLSGQDYPIKPTYYIKEFLEKNFGRNFIESFSFSQNNRWAHHEGRFQPLNRVQHWHFAFRSKMFHLPIRRNFPKDFEPYGGSQWWCLSKDCIGYIDRFAEKNPKFVNYFKNVLVPDEIFFQTVISNSPFKPSIANDDLRYADWENPNPNVPAILGKSDFDRLSNSPKLFARKFDVSRDEEILNLIDRNLIEDTRACFKTLDPP